MDMDCNRYYSYSMASKRNNTGNKLCSRKVRFAIYARDGFRCVYCRRAYDFGAKFSLDHITPHAAGGSDVPSNLVTSCQRCNSSKKDLDLDTWFTRLEHKGVSPRCVAGIRRRLATLPLKPLDLT